MLQGIECGRPEGLHKMYDAIASVLGVQTPSADLRTAADDIRRLEEPIREKTRLVNVVTNPRILCAASERYTKLDSELDVNALTGTFGIEHLENSEPLPASA